jgi:general secretion pathway protein C
MPSPTFHASLDRALRRFFGVLVATLLGLAAMLDAQGAMHAVAAKLGLDATQRAASPGASRSPAPATPEPHATSADAVLDGSALGPAAGPLEPQAILEVPEPFAAVPEDLARAPECDDVRVLVLAEADDPAWSVAALAPVQGDGPVVLRRRGGSFGRRSLAFVGRDRVLLAEGGRLCQARIFEGPRGSSAARAGAAGEVRRDASAGPSGDASRRIRRTGAASFDVDRNLVEQVLANPADLVSHARVAPDAQNGRLAGIRFLDVREGTLLGALGFQTDDRLEAINGFDLTSAENMMEAYARLRTADRLSVTVQRGAGRVTLDYAIR